MVTKENIADRLIDLDRRLEVLTRLRPQNPGGFDMLIADIKKRKAELLNTKVNN